MGKTVGIIGLGEMGYAYALQLRRDGFEVHGHDIDESRRELARSAQVTVHDEVVSLLEACERIITSLPSADALHDVVGRIAGEVDARDVGRSVTIIETSTLSLTEKERAQQRCAGRRIAILDCPVSGTAAQARRGDLTVFASGEQEAVFACSSIFEALGRSWRHVGPYGDGTKIKLVANLLVAVHNLATAEALTLGRKAGLDVGLLYEAICDSAATSRIFEESGRLVRDDQLADGLAKVQILNKDIRIIREYAVELGAVVPLLATTGEYYTSAMARGMERMEDASVSVLIELLSGLR